jgi:DnaJ-class molecular chaperone
MSDVPRLLHRARAELACEWCHNRGRIMTQLGLDECPTCHGFGRNQATIELLETLAAAVDKLEKESAK